MSNEQRAKLMNALKTIHEVKNELQLEGDAVEDIVLLRQATWLQDVEDIFEADLALTVP